jgi:uncharacterized Zn-binding protein involved in type VI secretion
MPNVALDTYVSTGHGCWPSTIVVSGTCATKSFFNGLKIQLLGQTKYTAHTCDSTTHDEPARAVSSASATFYMEGIRVARLGDSIACGDTIQIGQGIGDTFIG